MSSAPSAASICASTQRRSFVTYSVNSNVGHAPNRTICIVDKDIDASARR